MPLHVPQGVFLGPDDSSSHFAFSDFLVTLSGLNRRNRCIGVIQCSYHTQFWGQNNSGTSISIILQSKMYTYHVEGVEVPPGI